MLRWKDVPERKIVRPVEPVGMTLHPFDYRRAVTQYLTLAAARASGVELDIVEAPRMTVVLNGYEIEAEVAEVKLSGTGCVDTVVLRLDKREAWSLGVLPIVKSLFVVLKAESLNFDNVFGDHGDVEVFGVSHDYDDVVDVLGVRPQVGTEEPVG
jgi:hypothetical protein